MNYELKPELEKIMLKLKKKDPVSFSAVMNKIKEVVNSGDPDHYKPLRYDFRNKKRVHIRGSFVLIFTYDKQREFISFLDYDHHDIIYRRH